LQDTFWVTVVSPNEFPTVTETEPPDRLAYVTVFWPGSGFAG
jgi:hypothetical protein